MANSTTTLRRMENLERELQLLKIEVFLNWRKMMNRISIVKKTKGILGKKFPSGTKFENSVRKTWEERFKELKI